MYGPSERYFLHILCLAQFCPWSIESNTLHRKNSRQVVRITHPFHPQYGREFLLVTTRHNWGLHRVYFHDDDGKLKSLPAAWTDVFPPDPIVVLSAGRSAFRLQDLLELSRMIEALRSKGRNE